MKKSLRIISILVGLFVLFCLILLAKKIDKQSNQELNILAGEYKKIQKAELEQKKRDAEEKKNTEYRQRMW